MTTRLVCFLVLAISLIVASSANAKKIKKAGPAAPALAMASCPGSNLFHCGPLYNSTDYLGNDPDPFIRLMIQRDLGAHYGGEP
jgi:hypothetical protein